MCDFTGIPQQFDKPFMLGMHIKPMLQWLVQMCCEPGDLGVDCALWTMDDGYNVGKFRATSHAAEQVPAFRDLPTIPSMFTIHVAGVKEVYIDQLKHICEVDGTMAIVCVYVHSR